jgi:hypothetical protein
MTVLNDFIKEQEGAISEYKRVLGMKHVIRVMSDLAKTLKVTSSESHSCIIPFP